MVKDLQSVSDRSEKIASALASGIILVDPSGRVIWVDEATRRRLNGGLSKLELPLNKSNATVTRCLLASVELPTETGPTLVCVVQETDGQMESGYDLVAAVEAIMADPSWFTRGIVERLKAWCQSPRQGLQTADLDLLTDREREILGLICQGRSDVDMARILNVSPNTVRNHIASLYRKIGVNRRSAAVIWARERAITSHETLTQQRKRHRANHSDQ